MSRSLPRSLGLTSSVERLDPKLFNDATRKGSMLSGKLVTRSELAYTLHI